MIIIIVTDSSSSEPFYMRQTVQLKTKGCVVSKCLDIPPD